MPTDIKPPAGYDIDPTQIKAPKGYDIIVPPGQQQQGINTTPYSAEEQSNISSIGKNFLGNALPAAGAFEGPFGTVVGTLAQEALGGEFGGLKEGEGFSKVGKDLGINLTVNNLGPAALAKLATYIPKSWLSKIPGVAKIMDTEREAGNASQLKDKFLQDPELQTLPESNYPSGASRGAGGKFQSNPSGFAKGVNEGIRTGQDELNTAIYKGFKPTSGELNPSQILDELKINSKNYSNIDPMVKNDLTEFLTGVMNQKQLSKIDNPVFSWQGKKLIFNLGKFALGGAVGGAVGGSTGAAISGSGLVVTSEMLSRLMHNPTFAHAVIKSTTASPGAAKPLLEKLLIGGMSGLNTTVRAANGDEQTVHIGDNGELVPTRE